MTAVSHSLKHLGKTIDAIDFKCATKPLIIGISGPQGSGKSYLVSSLQKQLQAQYPQLSIVSFLMDDLYLTYAEQCRLTDASVADGNKLLQGRGLPGTHDIDLCLGIFHNLITRYKGGQVISEENPVRIPSYDKSAHGGLGDRRANDTVVATPADVVLFEGWFNGFRALDRDRIRLAYLLSDIGNVVQQHRMYHIEQVNTALAAYEPIWCLFDEFIYLHTDDINNVYQWRLQQEHDLIAQHGAGMTDAQVVDFIDRYMACYKLYYETMCDHGLPNVTSLRISIARDRTVVSTAVFTGE